MSGPRIALLYDDGAYVETLARARQPAPGAPMGPMGRQVAGTGVEALCDLLTAPPARLLKYDLLRVRP